MNVEPIINARFKRFRDAYELNDVDDGIAFEKFVNHAILSTHQPDAFAADSDLLESVSVGGSDDMGIDGIAVKLNGLLLTNIQDITDILDRCNRATVEFIFIQSKYKSKFDSGEFNKFAAGVRDFLSEEHFLPANDKVKKRLEIKDYLLSDDVVVIWEKNPTVRLYYVAMGKWRDNQHVIGLAKKLQDDIQATRTYDECHIHYVDAESLKSLFVRIYGSPPAPGDVQVHEIGLFA